MNKSYRSVYNEQTGTWVAVSEITTARGKKNKMIGSILGATVAVMGLAHQAAQAVAYVPVYGIVNSSATDVAVGASSLAATNAIAVGLSSTAVGAAAIAIGATSSASADRSIAIGYHAAVKGGPRVLVDAIAIGTGATAQDQGNGSSYVTNSSSNLGLSINDIT